MDTTSSSQFLSSLSKFLQSICNGYVTFNERVDVFGHVRVVVDDDQTFDYILQESVTKPGENNLSFSSKSFDAVPKGVNIPNVGNDRHKTCSATLTTLVTALPESVHNERCSKDSYCADILPSQKDMDSIYMEKNANFTLNQHPTSSSNNLTISKVAQPSNCEPKGSIEFEANNTGAKIITSAQTDLSLTGILHLFMYRLNMYVKIALF